MKRGLTFVFVWFVLAILGGLLAYLAYELMVAFGWTLIYSERFRPKSWNSETIAGVARGAILICGCAYVMYIGSIDGTLARWNKGNQFQQLARRRIALLGGTAVLLSVVLFILTYES